jgi:2-dehydropantoate 2-reductase
MAVRVEPPTARAPARVAVMGAGALGCYFGGMLARAGTAVTLIGRPQHVEAIRHAGLLLETQSFRARVPIEASVDPGAVRGAGLVLFCVKSGDTETAGAAIAPHLEREALVLSLQNGVDNATRLQSLLSQRVVSTVVYAATEMAGPGHVRHHGGGELLIEPVEGAAEIVALFADAGVKVRVSDNVEGALWTKLALNCAYNALSAVSQLPYGKLVQGEGVQAVMRDVILECLAVAQAAGVRLEGDVWEELQRIARTMPSQLSSTAQDLARGRRSEIDHLNGYLVRRGEALGVATPVNRVLHTVVKLLESRFDAEPVSRMASSR